MGKGPWIVIGAQFLSWKAMVLIVGFEIEKNYDLDEQMKGTFY